MEKNEKIQIEKEWTGTETCIQGREVAKSEKGSGKKVKDEKVMQESE